MWPIVGSIGGQPVYSYGLAVAVALGVCLALAWGRRRAAGLETGDLLNFVLLGIAALLFAPKIWAIVHTMDFGAAAWLGLLQFWRLGELSAGVVAAATALAWAVYAARRRIPLRPVLDAYLLVVLTGLAIQRAGCFLAGCCYGTPTTMPWSVRFPAGSPAGDHFPGQALHPVQLYYATAYLLIAAGLWGLEAWRRRSGRPMPPGLTAGVGLLLAGAAHAGVSAFRADAAAAPIIWVAGLAATAFGALLLGWSIRGARPKLAPAAARRSAGQRRPTGVTGTPKRKSSLEG
ncbi:MAG: prolipoprotein diacylglyceryl transferase [Acidobacteria bacterium]|nr:prolipoprotein diacylglyceryl transferase [Acidobacteriota bacterium]